MSGLPGSMPTRSRMSSAPVWLSLAMAVSMLYWLPCRASWRTPELKLTLSSPEIFGSKTLPIWTDSTLEGIDKEGNFYFSNRDGRWGRITALKSDGTYKQAIPPPIQWHEKLLMRGWPSQVRLLGKSGSLLVKSGFQEEQWCVYDREGRLVRTLDVPCGLYALYIYPDGHFVIWHGEGNTKTRPYSGKSDITAMNCVYNVFDKSGQFIHLLNRPPTWYGFTQVSEPLQGKGTFPFDALPHDIVFPDLVYHLAPSGQHLSSGASRLQVGGVIVWGAFDGWSGFPLHSGSLNPNLYNNEGARIGSFSYEEEWHSEELRLNKGLPQGYTRQNEGVVMDENRNLWAMMTNPNGLFIYKIPWVDEPPETPPAKIEKLDGFGFPLESSPMRGAPPYMSWPDGTRAHFIYPEQDIPLCGRTFPAYSLWDYELSGYQRDNPGAVMGRPTVTGAPDYVPKPWMPVNVLIDLTRLDQGKVFYDPRGTKQKGYELRVNREMTTRTHLVAYGKESGQSLDILDEPVVCYPLHTERPDILFVKAIYGPFPKNILAYETGADTKQFVTATIMTCATLEPRDLTPGQQATLRAHSVNWPDKKDTVTLLETAPGSRRFASEDGSVVYELAWVMDENKNLVERPGPDTSNYLYLYITDPKLGLVRAPQVIWETGVDTGEYRSWAEPNFSIINGGEGPWAYKPWPQTAQELKDSQFTVEVSGPGVANGSKLRVLWDEPGKGEAHADLNLQPGKDGTFVTTTPLLCFTPKGCDIGGTWQEVESHPTPQIPGAVTFRENKARFVLVNGL